NPFYAEAAEARAKVIEAKLKDLSKIKNETPQVPDDKVFDAIIAPHKGKVVLVDLWNTWCGPCRRALAANEPLKDGELSSPDIVWIYIADTSSETGSYSTMVPEIRGEHYMVNASQIKAIRDRFNVDGIPFYILVDREGNAEGHPDFRDHSALIEGIKSKL
ncbi:MAG: thioredoxin, partial [Muribaculaceae bacterium]|nr:thioredoxin [Muribaculaceae bacterium]